MNADHEKLTELLAKAVAIRNADERAPYLDKACHGEPQLRAQVEALLRAHDRAGDFLAAGVELRRVGSADEHIGARIGRYKLVENLGEGNPCSARTGDWWPYPEMAFAWWATVQRERQGPPNSGWPVHRRGSYARAAPRGVSARSSRGKCHGCS
jgi:hypothetical protein